MAVGLEQWSEISTVSRQTCMMSVQTEIFLQPASQQTCQETISFTIKEVNVTLGPDLNMLLV